MEVRKRMTKDVLSVAMSVVDFYKVPRPLAPSVHHVATEVPEELKRPMSTYKHAWMSIVKTSSCWPSRSRSLPTASRRT